MKAGQELKEKAGQLFKSGQYQEAIGLFADCLELDELNTGYNATIYFNMALCVLKQDKPEDALKYLNKAVSSNPKYAKAFYKRGEVN